MTSIFLALLLFGALATIGGIMLSSDEQVDDLADAPRRMPDPGPRDRYAMGTTLNRAPVPSWG